MKKITLLFLVAELSACLVQAQPYKYWIEFTDKNNSPYSLTNPWAYLSPRAILRRVKYNIPIKLNDLPPNPQYIDSVVAKGVTLLNRSRWFNAISIYAPDTTKLALIRALPFVKSGSLVTIMKPPIQNGSYKSSKHEFTETYGGAPAVGSVDTVNSGAAYNQEHMIGVDCLNNKGFRGKGMQIAQIDARFGIAKWLPAYDSLYLRNGVLGTWDFVWEIPFVYDDTNNVDSHGQMVLGCMAGNLPGQYLGDAADADYYLLRSEDIASEHKIEDDNWTSAAEYADSAGADIITSSLGYTTFDEGFDNFTYSEMNGHFAVASRAATIAAEKGMVVCVAAGNNGGSPWQHIDSPADADSILTVGAVDASGIYASFSGTGPTSDGRIKPDVAAEGSGTAICSPGGGVTNGSGTSFATPIMAGAVACLWQANPNASNFEIMKAIKQSATLYTHPNDSLGYGIPDFCLANTILSAPEVKPAGVLHNVYPDPFQDNLTAEFYSPVKQTVTVTLCNVLGQTVYNKRLTAGALGNTLITIGGLGYLPKGIYVLTIGDEAGSRYSAKVVK